MEKENILFEIAGAKATLSLNREEKRNALSGEMVRAILGHLSALRENDAVRVVCLTSAGGKFFCSGGDLGGMVGGGGAAEAMREYAELLKAILRLPKPVVCRLNGIAQGGGIGLMLACDIVVARSDVEIGTPEVNVGIFPMMIGALLYRNALWKKAMKMILTGTRVDALEAERMGLVSQVVPPEKFDAEVEALLENLAAKSPSAVRIGKEAFHAMGDMDFEASLDYLCEGLQKVMATEDAFEGMSAFLEKRKPQFKGR
jgi:enoyl-CoA hydratase/carnithine racemase